MNTYREKMSGKKALILAILAMAAPAIIEMGLNTLLGVADTIMIGQMIDSGAIASVGFQIKLCFS